MNFAHFAGFQALSFVDRTVPKEIVIFVGEMNVYYMATIVSAL